MTYPSDDELREIIADAENKIGDYHAIIASKRILVAALKELIQRRGWDDKPVAKNYDGEWA